ncbi:hypothetical protein CYJ25_01710 [Schaalia turicensis]|uniref:HK97 gp10 family phage protein n=1 Tax=Schaalia turicensis TaxID=131111 RepID=A0A2I1I774_9ACTO|nr:hypothetical protein [Schaalia turicensis]PKY66982.1 hypothetical protein CYJ25_01710 [Schaalia turicensis]
MSATIRMEWHGPKVIDMTRDAGMRGLTKAGHHLLSEAVNQTPIRDGILRGSGAVSRPDSKTVAVSFDTPYAVRQHEELGYNHPKGGKAKYLEDPLHDEDATMRALVAVEIWRALR